jgi:tetratricopeptide (TPR) repeat protein
MEKSLPHPTVFISYSHNSDEHIDRVLALSNRLRQDGIACILDQYETSPPEGWTRWMDRNIRDADFVLMICTETYYRRVMLNEEPGKGLGVKWEGKLILQHIYNADSLNTTFIPVLFEYSKRGDIPTPLQDATYYPVDTERGDEDLYRRLTNQPRVEIPDVGDIRKLPAMAALKRAPDFPTVKVDLSKLPSTSPLLLGRESQLQWLDQAWQSDTTHILSLVAWGGVGKTALVNYWLTHKMGPDDYRGARRVYGWSFYSQGTREVGQASGDEFLSDALEFFGDANPEKGTPRKKGVRLAGLVRERPTLLVLDGLEPLQHPPGDKQRRLRDEGVQALVKELAASNNGLCVITTREKVKDIEHTVGASTKEVILRNMSTDAGVVLLKNVGVRGSDKELRHAVEDFDGHALALNLLGSYTAVVNEGDIGKRPKIQKLIPGHEHGEHARRVMGWYERWLKGGPELDILYLMGLFDCPADSRIIDVLREGPAIKGLTERVTALSEAEWKFAVKRLQELQLLGQTRQGDARRLDCHPLIREYFGEKLSENYPEAWREAHQRLVRLYKKWLEAEGPDRRLAASRLPRELEELGQHRRAVEQFVRRCSLILIKEGMIGEAEQMLGRIEKMAEKIEYEDMDEVYVCRAEILTKMGKPKVALEVLDKAKVLNEPREDYLSARCLVTAGDCWHLADVYDKAQAKQSKAIEILKRLIENKGKLCEKDLDDVYELYVWAAERLAQATELTGELREANRILDETEQMFTDLGLRSKLLPMFWYRRGKVAQLLWDLPTAEKRYEECRKLAEEKQKPEAQAYGLRGLGEVMVLSGDWDSAEDILTQSKAIFKDCRHRGRLWIDRSLAQIKRQRALDKGMESKDGMNLLEESERAFVKYVEECQQMPNPNGEAWGWVCLGFLYIGAAYEGVWEEGSREHSSLECLDKAGEIFSQTKSLLGQLEVVMGRGLAYLLGLTCKVEGKRDLAKGKGLEHQANLLANIDSHKVEGRLAEALQRELLKPRNPA